jgi:hypothetical protein
MRRSPRKVHGTALSTGPHALANRKFLLGAILEVHYHALKLNAPPFTRG